MYKSISVGKSLLLALLALFMLQPGASAYEETLLKAPLKTIQGQILDLQESWGNKPFYIKFWASWCVPCNKQMPHFEHAYQTYGEQIQFLSVSIDINETQASVEHMLSKHGLTVPTIRDTDGKLAKSFELIGTPLHILLNKDGKVVHRGHDADEQLDTRLALLAAKSVARLPVIKFEQDNQQILSHKVAEKGLSLLYFSATWCDWYLKDSRPKQSQNCQEGQKILNQWHQKSPSVPMLGVVSRLWTTNEELKQYKDKYQIPYPLVIDTSNNGFIAYGIKSLPTLVVVKDGNEVLRLSQFTNLSVLEQKIRPWLQ